MFFHLQWHRGEVHGFLPGADGVALQGRITWAASSLVRPESLETTCTPNSKRSRRTWLSWRRQPGTPSSPWTSVCTDFCRQLGHYPLLTLCKPSFSSSGFLLFVPSCLVLISACLSQVVLSSRCPLQPCSLQDLHPGAARATSPPPRDQARPRLRLQETWRTWLQPSPCSRTRRRAAPPRASAAAPRWGVMSQRARGTGGVCFVVPSLCVQWGQGGVKGHWAVCVRITGGGGDLDRTGLLAVNGSFVKTHFFLFALCSLPRSAEQPRWLLQLGGERPEGGADGEAVRSGNEKLSSNKPAKTQRWPVLHPVLMLWSQQ